MYCDLKAIKIAKFKLNIILCYEELCDLSNKKECSFLKPIPMVLKCFFLRISSSCIVRMPKTFT